MVSEEAEREMDYQDGQDVAEQLSTAVHEAKQNAIASLANAQQLAELAWDRVDHDDIGESKRFIADAIRSLQDANRELVRKDGD